MITYVLLDMMDTYIGEPIEGLINKKHDYDKSGKSTTTSSVFMFNSGDFVRIICMDWSDEITNTLSWTDNLSVEIHTKEHIDWLNTQYK